MITPENYGQTDLVYPDNAPAEASRQDVDQQMLRIRRIGKRLFNVANCMITFGVAQPSSTDGKSLAAIETAFCRSQSLSNEQVIVPDTLAHPTLAQHKAVTEAPFIRFYASQPVFSQDNGMVIGAVSLIDYAPRMAFSENDRRMLADLAALVERELHLRVINASQIDLQKKNKHLRRKSLVDPLLGTWNRGAIMRILTIEAIRCDRAGVPLSLIVVDLDHFKKINDTYGHPAGDAVLVKVASRLRSCIRSQEALGRYGGEEFLIVLPGSSSATALSVAERMRATVAAQPEKIGGTPLTLTISAGVASTDIFPTATTEDLISWADMALYGAKDAGRNRVLMAMPELS